ncbi:MFS transporter [Streptomyces acidicola]|uniref:MFS transporter n=1 Tax=Streptomyces acidicola TaxID=2596892 RepID=UPI0034181744
MSADSGTGAVTINATTATTSTADSVRAVPILWLALLSAPIAAANNAPVLILGDMSRSLGVTTATAAWLVTVFGWALAVGTPLIATLLRMHGTRVSVLTSAALVVAGTVLVAASPWLLLTLAGRAAQAAGGAGMMAVAMSLAGTARRMGVISAGGGILGAVGPLLGQALTDAVSWRAALSLSLIAVLAVPAVLLHTKHDVAPAEKGFDTTGALLVTAVTTGIVLLPRYTAAGIAVAVFAAGLLAWHVRRRPDGFVPAVVLGTRVFHTAALIGITLSTSYFSLLFAVPRLLSDRAGWSSGAVALGQMTALITGALLALGFAAVSARLGRVRTRLVLLTAGVTGAVTAVFAHSAPGLLAATVVAVLGSTGANATQSMDGRSAVPPAQRPAAVGLFSLSYLLGGALGPALATALVLG